MSEQRLQITATQDAMLREAEEGLRLATLRFQAVAGAVIAGHDLKEAGVVRIEPDHILVVDVKE